MKILYDFFIAFAKAVLPLVSVFNKKLKLGVMGRKNTWQVLNEKMDARSSIWVHAASLGEYEQIVPVLEQIDRNKFQIVLSFFSPSGYEIRKNTPLADAVVYLPFDTKNATRKFLDVVKPTQVLFVKYEFWPNYLNELKQRNIATALVSAVIRPDQPFFKSYGRWMIKYLEAFDHFYVQDSGSIKHLKTLGFDNVTLSGDTRFDRSAQIIERDNQLDFMDAFTGDSLCMVAGSTWPDCENLIVPFINSNPQYKYVIAPHEIKEEKIQRLIDQLDVKIARYSTRGTDDLVDAQVLILDTIGLLTKVYSYADVAYVGGAAGDTGLHNILEPATFDCPVLIGKNYDKFPEASKLRDLGGLFSCTTADEFSKVTGRLLSQDQLRNQTGMICGHWINSNTGATRMVVEWMNN